MAAQRDIPSVVIPYRNRNNHLQCALARFEQFTVYVVEQADREPFNRGSLLNTGYVRARRQGARRVILHDVDLMPDDKLLNMYKDPWPRPVVHFGALFSRYNNSRSYFGGVHGFTAGFFPGYPNHFFGWGGEDDALRLRVRNRDMTYARHGRLYDLEAYVQPKDKLDSLSSEERCHNKWELVSADKQAEDNHRTNTLEKTVTWVQKSDRLLWAKVTHHRAA